MKLFVTETQFNLLTESVEGLNEFKKIAFENYPEIIEYWDVIENFIRECGHDGRRSMERVGNCVLELSHRIKKRRRKSAAAGVATSADGRGNGR